MRCGFEDSNYFSVVFNREVGMTPVQWRHRSRKQRNQFAMPEADDIGRNDNHHTAQAQHANRTTPGVVPLFQHQPNQPVART